MAKREMQILTIDEAATLLRITKRTLYRLREIPRVRIGHRWMFLKEDVEEWVHSRHEGSISVSEDLVVDRKRANVYHRNAMFVLPGKKRR
jgi:excisionase family DNA binding protein